VQDHKADVPFILVTGTVSEEFAVSCMKNGADDYILKNNLTRLPSAIVQAIKMRNTEKEKQNALEKLIRSEEHIRSFAGHLNHVMEEERAHLAREIHDELGQQLAGIKMGISYLKKQAESIKGVEEQANGILREVDQTIQSLRKIATELRPGILDTMGLVPSIEWLVNEFDKKTPIKSTLKINVNQNKFDKNFSTCFFRICQEALTNISKHAYASEVMIEVEQKEKDLTMRITDNGKGIANEKLANPFSMGLLGMHERANLAGAQLLINSKKNEGTSIELKAKIN
jgi:two-component system, NarL family, sensor histidine kinase UhpB